MRVRPGSRNGTGKNYVERETQAGNWQELSTICARRKLRELTTEVLNSEPQISAPSNIKLDGIPRC